jgi:hypothetical protein
MEASIIVRMTFRPEAAAFRADFPLAAAGSRRRGLLTNVDIEKISDGQK